MGRKDIRNEILKYISPKELEEAIEVKNTELKGLLSPEGAELVIAKELGIKIEKYTQKEEISEEILFKRFKETNEEIEKFEKINMELYKDVKGLPQHEWTFDEKDDTIHLMSVVGGILQFLEHKFPNALDINGMPIQRIIFQNARYRLYKRMNKIREKK